MESKKATSGDAILNVQGGMTNLAMERMTHFIGGITLATLVSEFFDQL